MRYLYLFILFSSYAVAQNGDLHNKGEVYVLPNTLVSVKSSLFNELTGTFINDGEVHLHGDLNNDGVLDFMEDSSSSLFIGSNIQKIQGTQPIYFKNVLFQNTSQTVPFYLYNEINVHGLASFNDGIVDNDTFGGTFVFRELADHINTSDDSHVDGPVEKIGNEDFIFPIGDDGYYRHAGISESSMISVYNAKYFYENSDPLYAHELRAGVLNAINHQEYWTIEKESIYEENALITLSWRDETTPSEFITAAGQEALTIVRWDVETNMWVNEGGVIDMDNQTVTTAVSGYGVFTFGLVDSDLVLPCGLTIYNAVTPNGDGVNDFFFIDTGNVECADNLHVQVFNRWGVKVFESRDYGGKGDVFKGYSNGRLTVSGSEQLPSGTYFYILDYEYGDSSSKNRHKQAGYLYLSGN